VTPLFRSTNQRGVALLSALMILALAALLAYGLIEQGRFAIDRAAGAQRGAQARALADGLFDYALIGLQRDAQNGAVDSRAEEWAKPLPALPVPQGLVSGRLEDLNGRINLNGFAGSQSQAAVTLKLLTRLLEILKLNPQIALRIQDAIDADDSNLGAGEDIDFMAARPATRAPNRLLMRVSELRNLPGLNAADYATLSPYVCATDTDSTLNINTAEVPVLMSLDANISEDLAKKIAHDGQASYTSVSLFIVEVSQSGGPANMQLVEPWLGVKSDDFLAHARIKLDGVDYRYTARLNRKRPQVVWRVQGQ
jgi:general secretion pathway protein K